VAVSKQAFDRQLHANQMLDPWDVLLLYEVRDGRARVCSAGPDRFYGTSDDVCSR